MREASSVRVTTLMDNDPWLEGLRVSWGLSFYVEVFSEGARHILLMDTGGSPDLLLENASKLHLNLREVETVFISHWHADHCGALDHLLGILPPSTPIYFPSENSSWFRRIREAGKVPIACAGPVRLMEGVWSTGNLGRGIAEHSLMVNVERKGLLLLVGCSHPGVLRILRRAREVSGGSVYGVIGGFHISSAREGARVGRALREMDVSLVSPCHCTRPPARREIKRVVGEAYVENGVGRVLSIGSLG